MFYRLFPHAYCLEDVCLIKICETFYFDTSLWWLKRVWRGCVGLHKTFLGATDGCGNKKNYIDFQLGLGSKKYKLKARSINNIDEI